MGQPFLFMQKKKVGIFCGTMQARDIHCIWLSAIICMFVVKDKSFIIYNLLEMLFHRLDKGFS